MKKKKLIATALIVFSVMLSSFAFYGYQILYTPNILVEKEARYFEIPTGSTFKELQDRLYADRIVVDLVAFSFVAKLKGYHELIKPGMYLLTTDMSNLAAINMLRAGRQTPVRMTFSHARQIQELAGSITSSLEIDSATFSQFLLSDSVAQMYGFTKETFISMFLPNTYEVYWTSSPKTILDRMKKEYDRFWTKERQALADSIGLTPLEVSTLASIVDWETNILEEAPLIAGVYLNRLKRDIPLQADPTLVFAHNDFTIRRVLNKHKEIDSPYNTYRNLGLPPGPVMLPQLNIIDAVLNYEKHRYLYFCAKADFSGYHVFASTLREHNRNAERFQQALNRQRIYK